MTSLFVPGAQAEQAVDMLSAGIASRAQGKLQLSIDQISQAVQQATTDQDRMRATGELGIALLQARRLDQSRVALSQAYAYFKGAERAVYALDLGNLSVISHQADDARKYYKEAMQLASNNARLHAMAGLNLAWLAPAQERYPQLAALYQEIRNIHDAPVQAALYLNLGSQARKLGKQAVKLAYLSLDNALRLETGQKPADNRLQVETLDAMAQLYEDQGRLTDALTLTQQAIAQAASLDASESDYPLIGLEWRVGRIQEKFKHPDLALAAYQRAVDQIEAVRQDIPIENEDGSSTFSVILKPVYMGLADLLLQRSGSRDEDDQATYSKVIATAEMVKQSELQDYLGDRCTVEAVKGGSSTAIPVGTAVLYPIVFTDRIELLLKTGNGISRFTTDVSGEKVRQVALKFSDKLRNGDDGYLPLAGQLYDWLLRPFEAVASSQHIHTLVIASDGALRLVAMAALYDGKQFAIERYAISTVTGMTMTNTTPPDMSAGFLVAGLSHPGPVVDKLNPHIVAQIFSPQADTGESSRGLARGRSMRSMRSIGLAASYLEASKDKEKIDRSAELREALALPGVKLEVSAIGQITDSTPMLDSSFTVNDFRKEAETGEYRIVHIATHGIFGGSADTSYILAYDDLLTLNGLQSLLQSEQFRKHPIELLSLSACETAEGNDRAPLGISGAAIRARAKSVLGTLWPVDDNAAREVMAKFYSGIESGHLSKTDALREAQISLIHTQGYSHPMFWAPFDLIGNWL